MACVHSPGLQGLCQQSSGTRRATGCAAPSAPCLQQHVHLQQRWPVPHKQQQQHGRMPPASAFDQQQSVPAPWSLTFDLRERETEWTEANKARLVALVTAQQLSISMAEMEARLEALVLLLPDLAGQIQRLQPSLLAALTTDLQLTSSRLLALKELLPDANVSAVVASRPQLLLQDTSELQAAVGALRELLQLQHVDRLVEAMPLFLVTECVQQALGEIQRLMPGSNAATLLASDPEWLLRVQRGQQWLGLHPDSELGEQVQWSPPVGDGSSSHSGGQRS